MNDILIQIAKKAADEWKDNQAYHQASELIYLLIAEIEKQYTPSANPPLTLDVLMEMDGELVWVVSKNGDAARDWPGDWHTVDIENRWLIDRRNRCWTIHNDPANDQFIAYRHKPEGEDEK